MIRFFPRVIIDRHIARVSIHLRENVLIIENSTREAVFFTSNTFKFKYCILLLCVSVRFYGRNDRGVLCCDDDQETVGSTATPSVSRIRHHVSGTSGAGR